MKMIPFLCVTGALLSVGCATTAPPTYQGAQSITPAARAAIADGHADQVTCWREKPNGSHLTQKYCATKTEVADIQKKDRQTLFNLQMQGQAKNTDAPP